MQGGLEEHQAAVCIPDYCIFIVDNPIYASDLPSLQLATANQVLTDDV